MLRAKSHFDSYLIAGRDRGQDNTCAPLYSGFLANTLGMHKVYQQYMLYLAAFRGSTYIAGSMFKAYNLAKYVKYKDQPGRHESAQYAADLARAAPRELEHAGVIFARFRARGVATAAVAPML